MRLRRTACVLVGLLAFSATAAVAHRPATTTAPVCGPRSGQTLNASRAARVYLAGRDVYGCSGATKRRTFLGTDSRCVMKRRVGPVALTGDLVAYGSESCGVDTGFAQVLVRRLSDGAWLLNARSHLVPLGPESGQMVDSIVLDAHGAVAWIASGFSVVAHQGEDIEVAEAYHRTERLLDYGASIPRYSLRLLGTTIRWRHGHSWRSAPLSASGASS